ncbi:unnamed protein product [Amoebophrya sp. A25]|nr:unnamed protein product [Amoebophrya sp. A25]|eukprot:GSA25T00024753001.1
MVVQQAELRAPGSSGREARDGSPTRKVLPSSGRRTPSGGAEHWFAGFSVPSHDIRAASQVHRRRPGSVPMLNLIRESRIGFAPKDVREYRGSGMLRRPLRSSGDDCCSRTCSDGGWFGSWFGNNSSAREDEWAFNLRSGQWARADVGATGVAYSGQTNYNTHVKRMVLNSSLTKSSNGKVLGALQLSQSKSRKTRNGGGRRGSQTKDGGSADTTTETESASEDIVLSEEQIGHLQLEELVAEFPMDPKIVLKGSLTQIFPDGGPSVERFLVLLQDGRVFQFKDTGEFEVQMTASRTSKKSSSYANGSPKGKQGDSTNKDLQEVDAGVDLSLGGSQAMTSAGSTLFSSTTARSTLRKDGQHYNRGSSDRKTTDIGCLAEAIYPMAPLGNCRVARGLERGTFEILDWRGHVISIFEGAPAEGIWRENEHDTYG